MRNEVPVDDWFDPRYLDAALRDLGLQQAWTPYDAGGKPVDQPR